MSCCSSIHLNRSNYRDWNRILITGLVAWSAGTASAALPDPTSGIDDTMFIRTHGRGDIVRLVQPFNACTAFPGGGHSSDPGSAIHARLRVRLAPFSEYAITDEVNDVDPATGRILWTQGAIDSNNYAGFTIGYRYDTSELYFVVGDSGPTSSSGDERTRVYKINYDLDTGEFFTIDWTFEGSIGKVSCWINGTQYTPTNVINGTIEPLPQLNGNWYMGALMGNPRTDGLYTLAGRGWDDEIGDRGDVWPTPNSPSSGDPNKLDQSTSVLGDVSYAAFRWANATDSLASSPWDVELKIDDTSDGLVPTDSAGGLDSQLLMSAESSHDTILPSWADTAVGEEITDWFIEGVTNYEQTRQLMFYHQGLGDQVISVSELIDSTSGAIPGDLDQSLVCVIGPAGEVVYWSVDTLVTEYTLVGSAPINGVHTVTLPSGEPGVYRFIVKSEDDEGYAFRTDQEALYWGAYAPLGKLMGVDGFSLADTYAYIPADSAYDDANYTATYDIKYSSVSHPVEYARGISTGSALSTKMDDTWYHDSFGSPEGVLAFGLSAGWEIEARRFPLVLSNSRYAAEYYIRAGVVETNNYTLWSPDEKVLRDRIAVIASSGLGIASSIIEDFSSEEAHLVNNPMAYASITTYPESVPVIHTALNRQITSASSAMLGSIDHDLTDGINHLIYGDEPDGDYNYDAFGASMLFWSGWDDSNANPYYGNADFQRRARIAMLAYTRHIQGTRLRRNVIDSSTYPGNMGLAGTDSLGFGLHWGRVYGILDSDDKIALLPSIVIQLCHVLNNDPTTTRNQDSHFLPLLYEAGRLWDDVHTDTTLLNLCEEYAREIVDIPSPWAGEDVAMQEANGFDGSYSGMQNFMLAAGWLVSGNKFDPSDPTNGYDRDWSFLADAIDRQYSFWSHFMFPSGDGSHIGFAHDSDSRTVRGAVAEQYSGAKVIGPRASVLAARLLFQDGSSEAQNRIDISPITNELASDFPINTSVEAPTWNGARNGEKFDLMPLYAGGLADFYDINNDPIIDLTAVLPCEVTVSSGVEIEVIDEGYIAVNTPDYYAIIATNIPYSYYYTNALGRYSEARDIEIPDIETIKSGATLGGGDHLSENYADGKDPYLGEEIGGVGLSLFYDKTAVSPNAVIVGRNFSPLTTHQLIGYTTTGEDRRWAKQDSRSFPISYHTPAGTGAELTINYELNSDTGTSYTVQRVFDFQADNIDVTVTVSYPATGTPESLDRIVENIPIELDSDMIGSSERASRLARLELEDLPWITTNDQWDVWCATDWSVNNGLSYTGPYDELVGQEIGWIQKTLALPTSGNPTTFSYSIEPSVATSRRPGAGSDKPDADAVIRFIRAAEIGDMSADLDGDGKITQEDLRIVLER